MQRAKKKSSSSFHKPFVFIGSTKKDQQDAEECSPRKMKKENVQVPDPFTGRCLSPRKVKFENGGILKDVQNSPRKEIRTNDILEEIMDEMVTDSPRTLGDMHSPVLRKNLVLPASPCKKVKSSPHKRALSFNFVDEDNKPGKCRAGSVFLRNLGSICWKQACML